MDLDDDATGELTYNHTVYIELTSFNPIDRTHAEDNAPGRDPGESCFNPLNGDYFERSDPDAAATFGS